MTLLELLGPNVSSEYRDALSNPTARCGKAMQRPVPTPEQFKTTCGRRRVFLSARDADRYARGYFDHPALAEDAPDMGPYLDGYYDREDEVMAAFDRDNDFGDDMEEA